MRSKNLRLAIVLFALISLTFGCGGAINSPVEPGPENLLKAELPLATPVAQSPAVGICAEFEGLQVLVTIYPDIPDPRCTAIKPEQVLKVINQREETLAVKIGHLEAALAPGESHIFGLPFGEYLAPGVHRIEVQPCCGAELVLGEID